MRKPVVKRIRGHLFLLATIGLHPPDLHAARSVGIEVNKLAVRGVVRPIIESFSRSQALLFAPIERDCIDVKLAVSFGTVGEGGPVGRRAMPIRWPKPGKLARHTARN